MTEIAFHPGSYLQELLVWRNVSHEELAVFTGLPEKVIVEVTAMRRGIDQPISEGLAGYFGNSARYWLELQYLFDRGENKKLQV